MINFFHSENRVRFDLEGRGTFGYAVTLTGFTNEFGPDQDRRGQLGEAAACCGGFGVAAHARSLFRVGYTRSPRDRTDSVDVPAPALERPQVSDPGGGSAGPRGRRPVRRAQPLGEPGDRPA